jgi:hypothetical protein
VVFDGGKFFDHGYLEVIVLFQYERLLIELEESWILLHGWHWMFISSEVGVDGGGKFFNKKDKRK